MLERIVAGSDVSLRAEFADGSVVEQAPAADLHAALHSARAERRARARLRRTARGSLLRRRRRHRRRPRAAFRAGFASGLDMARSTRSSHCATSATSGASRTRRSPRPRPMRAFTTAWGRLLPPWLDVVSMTHTCAYWEGRAPRRGAAQQDGARLPQGAARRRRHLRRRRLGWGGCCFAWDQYRAIGTGVNATTEQVDESRARFARRGPPTRPVVECDFREIPAVRQAAVDRHARARRARPAPEVVRARMPRRSSPAAWA